MTRVTPEQGKHVAIDSHSGKIWLTAYNGQGVVIPLDRASAIKLRTALMSALLEAEKDR
jgi:hypothetical protein